MRWAVKNDPNVTVEMKRHSRQRAQHGQDVGGRGRTERGEWVRAGKGRLVRGRGKLLRVFREGAKSAPASPGCV